MSEPLSSRSENEPRTEAGRLAKRFHETYERLAPNFGYKTRKESAVPWEDVPAKNRALMEAVCAQLLTEVVPVSRLEDAEGERDDAQARLDATWKAAEEIQGKALEFKVERDRLLKLLGELYEYVEKIEGAYGGQAAVRSYMLKPDELHPGVEKLGERVRAALSTGDREAAK